jgi:hypothetical protein
MIFPDGVRMFSQARGEIGLSAPRLQCLGCRFEPHEEIVSLVREPRFHVFSFCSACSGWLTWRKGAFILMTAYHGAASAPITRTNHAICSCGRPPCKGLLISSAVVPRLLRESGKSAHFSPILTTHSTFFLPLRVRSGNDHSARRIVGGPAEAVCAISYPFRSNSIT